MRAVVYNGPRDMAVQDVPDATIEKSTEVLVRMTSTISSSGPLLQGAA
jgi:glutathione-independent formaldehyde dehydrogenase